MVKYRHNLSYLHSLFILFLVLLTGSQASAQGLSYDYYAIREGLGNRLVVDIEFDPLNLVWVATGNGLYRFDGYDFVSFSAADNVNPKYRLSQTKVRDIAKTADGNLLLLYEDLFSSFDLLDPVTFEVRKIEVSLQVDGQPRNFYVNDNGDIYVVAKGNEFTTIAQFDYATEEFVERYRLKENWKKQYPIIDFLVTTEGDALIYDQEHGLRRCFSNSSEVSYQTLPFTNTEGVNPIGLSFLHQDKEERLWLSYNSVESIFQYDVANDSIFPFLGLDDDLIYTGLWEDDSGNLIFNQADNSGNFPASKQLFCLSGESDIIDFSHLLELSDYILTIRSKDFFRTLFFGTDTGMKVAQNTTTRVERFLSQRIGEDRRGFSMRGICEDDSGNIYFAREIFSWYKLDESTNNIDTIRLHDKHGKYLNYNNCQDIWYDDNGYVWGVTGDGTDRSIGLLHQYDVADCNTATYEYPLDFTSNAGIAKGKFWIGARSDDNRGELVCFDTLTTSFNVFVDKDGNNPFANTYIRYVLSGKTNNLWVGTEQGLFEINLSNNTFSHFTKSNVGSDVFADNVIYNLFLNANDILWIGTLNGLSGYNTKTKEWKKYDMQDGLASNTIACILPASEENAIWVSTYNGLSYFKPGSDQSRQFFQIDGLSHNEFNRFSACRSSSGRYYFGGVNGVNAFKGEELLIRRDIPKVLLASYEHYDTRLDSTIIHTAGVLNQHEIVIEPHHDYFSLNFALPIYIPTTTNEYRYKVGDLDGQEWISLKGDRSLRYNDIKAGEYTLYVQGADSNGTWGKDSLMIRLIVREVIYRRTWFLALVSLLVLGGVFAITRYRLQEKLRMERLRTQLASDLHDEVSGLLAGISLQSELIRDRLGEEEEVLDKKLQNIRQASQLAMSKMSDVIWSIDSRRDRVSDLINRMEEHADEVLLPLDIRYKLNVKQLDRDQAIPANIRQNVYFIYKEAINNIAKHAKATLVDVNIGNQGQWFELVVKDDGIGAKKSETNGKKRKGQGLSNLRMRAQRLNAQLDIMNGQGFTIHLRMKRFLK